ncbi:TolC family outer membrane protein [Ramlibacter albus]|uniref:TolC family outer membrane protein n=1 Tax=Ramlibacter albus TaxID=2079448 RepID=A0A923MAQ6_9BURK|nr:TolC family outer membrane protein [Ramlibacter albus]MBC5765884.1 TolC family outer membrane protein [Ramlibacter albus]
MKSMRLVPLALAVGLAFAAPARAESLLQLYEAARAQDANWQSARSQYEANLARAAQAVAGILPQAGLAANVTRSHFELDVPPADRYYTTQSATVSASQPLYRPANWATFKQGDKQAQQAEYQLTVAGQDLVIRVSQAYFDVLAAQDTLAFVRAQKAAVAEQLASAKRNFEVGTATITDTREAQARYDLVLAQEIAAENDLRVKKLALDTIVGKNNVEPDPVAVTKVPSPQPADPEAWVQQAEAASPQILLQRAAVDIATLEVDKARAGHKPTVDLVASQNVTRNVGGSTTSGIDNRPKLGSIGLNFNLPLFAGFATQNRIRETLALEQKARDDLEATRRTVAQQVRTAYFGVVSGEGQVRALEAAEASSQSALDANRLGYQVGVRINIDVLNAQSQLFQTKRDLAQARYNVVLGHLKLRQANGTLTPDDLTRLSQLLKP